jgi:hypothetical protein
MINFYRTEKNRAFTYTRIGENHVLSGQDNQDNIVFERLDNAWYMVIADGVSSAIFAKEGAKIAVDVIRSLCKKMVLDINIVKSPDRIKVDIVQSWKSKIESRWDAYATTINFAIYVNRILLLGQIGDGLIVSDTDKETVVMTTQEDFYSAETYALATRVKKSCINILVLENTYKVRLYMSSDGIGKEINEESRIELLDYLENMMTNDDVAIEKELDVWACELGRKNGDDKSIGFVEWEE